MGARILGVIGGVLYLGSGWLYFASGLVVPAPWYLVLWGVWIAGWWLVVRVLRRNPGLTPLVALGSVALWLLVVQLGDWLLGWTA
ncbi:MAG: hypothetical protein L0Z49_11715 [Actinobacteria bacterium]|nr:hypothetical protein [Actinomycetota bacterium]MCI0545092.1 hypothetical protein [Actinomycetota bacterium]MCI0677551.1 hypothetical protein [Actinomycetota bacterium]